MYDSNVCVIFLQQEQYSGMKKVFQKTLYLLRLLIRENEAVQFRIFNNLDILLDVQVVPSDLALALKEVSIKKTRPNNILIFLQL